MLLPPEPRPRLPEPAWMRAWPPGLRPRVLRASAAGVELIYRSADDRFYRVRLAVSVDGRLSVHAIPSGEREGLVRLVRALGVRLAREAEAARWVERAVARARALASWASCGGSGRSLPPAQQACDAFVRELDTALAYVDIEADANARARVARALARLELEVDAEIVEVLGVISWLALGQFALALEAWDRARARIEAGESLAFGVCAALMAGFVGRAPTARAALRELIERSRDGHDLRVAGEIYERLQLPGEASDAHARGAGEQDDYADWRRAAVSAAKARLGERTREAARRMLARASDPPRMFEAAMWLREGGAFIEAERVLERLRDGPEHPRATLELARSHLWRLELDGAARLARELLESEPELDSIAELERILGAAALLGGDAEAAIERLDRAITHDPHDDEARLWRARALARLGSHDAAEQADAELARTDMGDHPAWQLLVGLVREQLEPGAWVGAREWYFIEANLRQLLGDDEPRGAPITEQIERALARLGGNLGPRLTSPIDHPDALRWLDELASPRARAENLQKPLLWTDVETVLAGFERFAEAFPEVPTAVTYAAEIHLWLGNYARASDMFERIWAATRTRWGYVGGGAAALLRGELDRALELWAEGLQHYDYLDAEATWAYRGELHLRRGELDRARADLEHAVAAKPGRLGAWVALGLVHARAGDEAELRRCFDQVEAAAPVLVHLLRRAGEHERDDVRPATLAALLEAALERLRGNRSTVLYTFEDRGELHVLEAGALPSWAKLGARLLEYACDELIAAVV